MRLDRTCCQCGAVGAVRSKYAPAASEQAPVPISWTCVVCARTVCINCVQLDETSDVPEILDDTLCSPECRRALEHWSALVIRRSEVELDGVMDAERREIRVSEPATGATMSLRPRRAPG